MQFFRTPEGEQATLVGWGLRVMLLTADRAGAEGATARRLSGAGGRVEAEGEMFAALSAVIDDPAGYGLVVIECDGFGGLEAGHRAHKLLRQAGLQIAVVLIGTDCVEQRFPEDSTLPTELRAPLTGVALRVALEHVTRYRRLRVAE
ncbi:MAG: hypothetical protein QM656_13115 [Paracoccaceae bacterium]